MQGPSLGSDGEPVPSVRCWLVCVVASGFSECPWGGGLVCFVRLILFCVHTPTNCVLGHSVDFCGLPFSKFFPSEAIDIQPNTQLLAV